MPVISFSNFDVSTIPKDTVFVLDTNVLYYVHSGYYLPGSPKCTNYSNLIQALLTNGYPIIVSALSVQELLFGIENKEYELYRTNHRIGFSYSKKDFRNDKAQKASIKSKFKTVLAELSLYKMENGSVTLDIINRFVDNYESHKMDPMDYILANNYAPDKTIFVSADKDFQSLPSITILTA